MRKLQLENNHLVVKRDLHRVNYLQFDFDLNSNYSILLKYLANQKLTTKNCIALIACIKIKIMLINHALHA